MLHLYDRSALLEASQQRVPRSSAPCVRFPGRFGESRAGNPQEWDVRDDRHGLERSFALLGLLRLRWELDPHVVRSAFPVHVRHVRVPDQNVQEVRSVERLGGRDDREQRDRAAGDGVRVRRDLLARTDVSAAGFVGLPARHGQRQRDQHAVSETSGIPVFRLDFFLCRRERRERCDTQVGEDNDNVYSLAGSAYSNVVDSVENNGFGFAAKRDLAMWACRGAVTRRMNKLRSILLTETIVMRDLIDFLQTVSTFETTNVISLETAETANVGEARRGDLQEERLVNTLLTLEKGNFTFAYKRLLLSQYFIVSTPGILNLFQGSEYFEEDNFADLPSPLRIKEKVGNGADQLTGINAGFYKATKRLIQLRVQYELYKNERLSVYFFDNDLFVLAFLRETAAETLVTIVNLSHTDFSEKL